MADKLATVKYAENLGKKDSGLTDNKLIKKSEVYSTGCSLSNSSNYKDNQCIKEKDLYYVPPITHYDIIINNQCQFMGFNNSSDRLIISTKFDIQSPVNITLTSSENSKQVTGKVDGNSISNAFVNLSAISPIGNKNMTYSMIFQSIDGDSITIQSFSTSSNSIHQVSNSIQFDIEGLLQERSTSFNMYIKTSKLYYSMGVSVTCKDY